MELAADEFRRRRGVGQYRIVKAVDILRRTANHSRRPLASGKGYIYLGFNPFGTSLGGATLDNASGTTLLILCDQGVQAWSGATTFTNEGLIEKALTTGITTIAVDFTNTNTGTVAVDSGTLDFTGAVAGTGSFIIGDSANLEFSGSVAGGSIVSFAGSTGTLQIASSGATTPFSINGGGNPLPAGDVIDLPNISFDANADSYDANVIKVSDGTVSDTVTIDVIDGIGNGNTFVFASDGHGGTEVYDPPASANAAANAPTLAAATSVDGTTSWFQLGNDQINLSPGQTVTDTYTTTAAPNGSQTLSVTIGGPGNDNFVFAPGIGADTIVNFNGQNDTIQLSGFANAQTVQELAQLITTDAHGDAVIALGHNDSITIPGVSATYLQQHLQSMVHLS